MLVCAVHLVKNIEGLTDSKKLSKKRRQELATEVLAGNHVGFGWVSAGDIDDYGLGLALTIAANKALNELDTTGCPIIVDGNIQFYDLLPSSKTLIKADSKEPAVSAASIVAKVARDNYMINLANLYPQYGFDKHVGYGTSHHRQAINKYGLSGLHRKSFKIPNQTIVGA